MTAPSKPDRWLNAKAPSLDELERMADEAYRQLPEQFRALCKDLVIRVTEYATEEVLDSMGIESELDLMGLLAISLGNSALAGGDDRAALTKGFPVYDALYAWARRARGETHNWPAKKA